MSSISATYLEHKLINFDKVLYKMKTIYKIYSKFLCNLKLFKVNDISSSIQPNGYMFTLEYKLSNSINNKIKQLKKYGITVGNVYPETISDQKGFKKDDDKILNGLSKKITKTIINLPIYNDLTEMDLSHIIKVFRNLDKIDVVIRGYGRRERDTLKNYHKIIILI